MKPRIKNILFLIFAFIFSAFVGWKTGGILVISEKPSEYIGLIFSILAASIFAIITIISDPSMLMSGSWRTAWENAKKVQEDIFGFNYLFLSYLITLGLLVVSEMIKAVSAEQFYFIFNIFSGVATFSFLWSFRIPFVLWDIQKKRLEQEINARKGKK